ncbi:unnamed protein product [Prorocentrum cordatum]|uniref:Uncharacterized protein n=1 Tax=Prorocentrum cordatum TaxID=2364126 RepID=A0ABN9UUK6_9DINO|nr:unnamed protein product [Polarella glacialis]
MNAASRAAICFNSCLGYKVALAWGTDHRGGGAPQRRRGMGNSWSLDNCFSRSGEGLTEASLREAPYLQAHLFDGKSEAEKKSIVKQLNELDAKLPAGGIKGCLPAAEKPTRVGSARHPASAGPPSRELAEGGPQRPRPRICVRGAPWDLQIPPERHSWRSEGKAALERVLHFHKATFGTLALGISGCPGGLFMIVRCLVRIAHVGTDLELLRSRMSVATFHFMLRPGERVT